MISLIPTHFKIIAATVAVIGIFGYTFKKGHDVGTAEGEAKIQALVDEATKLKADLEKEQSKIKEKVVIEYVDKIKVVKEKEYVYVDQAKNAVPSQYNLSNGWVYLHDQAVSPGNSLPDSARVTDATASDTKDNQALAVILGNYSICLQNAQQLTSLQQYFLETKKSIDAQNENRKLKKPWK